VFALGLLALLAVVYLMTARELILAQRPDHAASPVDWLLRAPAATLPIWISNEIAQGKGFAHIALISAAGERIAGDMDIDHVPKTGHPIELPSRFGPVRLVAARTANGETIVVARDVSQIAYLRGRILLILLSTGVVILFGLTSASVLLAIGPLRRVRDLEQAAGEIARGRFETRMPIAGRGDELDQIAGTVNLMVDEIGRVMAQVKGVTDAIAHDLRTPARPPVRAPRSARSPAAPRLRGAREPGARGTGSGARALRRFAAHFRDRNGRAALISAPINLAVLLRASGDQLYVPLAEDRGVSLSHRTSGLTMIGARRAAAARGDQQPDRQCRQIRTLDGRHRASRAMPDQIVTLVIRDDGSGIPEDEREAVLRRFHRGSNATICRDPASACRSSRRSASARRDFAPG
jgi:HAMP domain-containing protein